MFKNIVSNEESRAVRNASERIKIIYNSDIIRYNKRKRGCCTIFGIVTNQTLFRSIAAHSSTKFVTEFHLPSTKY